MTSGRRSILIMSFSDHRRDPRVHRQIAAVHGSYDVTTAGICPNANLPTRHVQLLSGSRLGLLERSAKAIRLTAGQYERQYWTSPGVREAYARLQGLEFDVIIANDIVTAPLALRLAGSRAKVYLDAHEYEPRHWDNRWTFNFFYAPYWHYICAQYLPAIQYMTTVCEGIAAEYARNYGVKCDVIVNAPEYEELEPSEPTDARIRMIHHGRLHRSREIESMMELTNLLDSRFSLDLMVVNKDPRYMKRIQRVADRYPRVQFVDPVPMLDIARTINEYDIGLFMLSPAAFSYRMALPNKIFEFIQARLAVAIWPSPEMKRLVEEEGVGVVADDFSVASMARILNAISQQDVRCFKAKTAAAARKYNASKNAVKLRKIVSGLLE